MSVKPEEVCFHCEIVAVIKKLYPAGIDGHDAHTILMGLARVAGDILGNDASLAPFHAFGDTVLLVRNTQPRELKFIDRTKH